MKNLFEVEAGYPKFRLTEASKPNEISLTCYSSELHERDLECWQENPPSDELKFVEADPKSVPTAKAGSVIFNTMTGKSAIVLPERDGCYLTSNFAILKPKKQLDPSYLVYLLNEDPSIARQWKIEGHKFSPAIKFSLTALRELDLPELPDLQTQQRIGQVYLAVKRKAKLEKRNARRKEKLTIELLKRRP